MTQFSTKKFFDGWMVVNTAMMIDTKKPRIQLDKAMYLGIVAEYSFWDSSVATPSRSSYSLCRSSYPLPFAFILALLKNCKRVGTVVEKMRIRATKSAMAEGLGDAIGA